MWKQVVIALAVVGVVAATACSGGTKAKPQIFPVQVDGKTAAFAAEYIAYFPNEVQAHPGDEVDFTDVFSGAPHTVTLGKAVDDLFALEAKACPNGGPAADPACAKGLPAQYADQYNTLNGKLVNLLPQKPGDAPQAAANACFLATGDMPSDGSACAKTNQPSFDGTQTVYNSGVLEDQVPFKVKLADNIAPGTYNYFCLLHREGMSGTITVVAKNTKVATPAEVTKKGTDQLSGIVAKLKPEFDKLASLKADTAQAGALSKDAQNGIVAEFGPKEISIPVGGSVTWTVLGPHTISFNAPESARPIIKKGGDGAFHINQEGAAPAPEGGAGQPAPDPNAPPPTENAPPTLIDAGTWDGTGLHSSGLILSFPPALFSYKLTFTTAGTYKVVCLVHPDMEGTVKVGG
jgi:plastocyanin